MTASELLDQLSEMIVADFGPPNDGPGFPLCFHCQAHWALETLRAIYEDREIDQITRKVLGDSESLPTVSK